jgi:hypothetical protein
MTAMLILAVVALALVAALEHNHRRNADAISAARLAGSSNREDRDVARIKLDLLALGGRAEPHKPFDLVSLRRTRLFSHDHGRHAA